MTKKIIIIVISIVVAISVLAVNVDLDFDNNQIIDGSDLTTFAFSFGKSVAKGNFVIGDRSNADRSDVNNDGVVDGSDLTVLAFDFGKRVIAQSCSDNTAYGQCSVNKPKYCDNGNLIDNCLRCGCNSGYECVGTSCVLVVAKTCSDGIRNQDETDVDCGGSCTDCGLGKLCLVDSDCLSNNCDGGKCAVTTTQTTNQISQFGITWTFDRPVQYGKFANGDYWVVGPVTIIDIEPKSGDDGTGRIVHGSMINPSPIGGRQGYDSAILNYVSSLNVARPNAQQISSGNPLTVQPGSSLVSTISTPDTSGRAMLDTAAILTVFYSPAPYGSFRPSYSGSDKTIKFNKDQLDYSLLGNLPITSGIRSSMPRLHQQPNDDRTIYGADSVERMFERPWLDHIPGPSGRPAHPLKNMDDYDRDISNEEGTAALMLHLDFSNEPDFSDYGSNKAYKETLLIRFVQVGIDNYGVIQDGGRETWYTDSGRKFPILFAGLMLNDPDMKNIGGKSGDYAYSSPYGPSNPPPDIVYFEEDTNMFYVGQAHVAMTHSTEWNPDSRDAVHLTYETQDIGLPEWGKVRSYGLTAINKYWTTTYREVIGPALDGFALAINIIGAKDLWNHDVFFDYIDRFVEIESIISPFRRNVWNTYRDDYGCTWTREDSSPCVDISDPNDSCYSQGHYDCGGAVVRCEQISSCSQYPNQRALNYDPCNLDCAGGTTNQLSQYGITWTFSEPVQYGQFANEDYWVVGPVAIIGITPTSRDDGTGRIVHGSMLNPSPRTGYSQGYDSTMYREYDQGWYTPSLNVARPNNQQLSSSNPLTIQTGSLISSISLPATDEDYGQTQLQTAAILTVLSNPAPAGSFRPPYSGSDKTIKFNKNQLDYSILRRLAPVANTPRLKQQAGDAQTDSVERMFERPWLDHIPLWPGLGRSHHPKDNMANYGRDISTQVGIGALMLNLDYTNQEKETLLIRFTQLGIDIYGIIQDGGEENFMNGGGQSSGHKFPILLAGLALNDNSMKNIGEKSGDYLYSNGYGPGNDGSNWPPDFIAFGEDDQTFYVAQLDVDATHSATWEPDYRDAQKIPYTSADIELPEWGIIHANGPERSNKYWNTAYRPVNGCGWPGWVLAVHIVGLKDLWNHDALFDYQDRYMEVTADDGPYPGWRSMSSFAENMWDTYRDDYGCVLTLDDSFNTYSQGHYNCGGAVVRCEQISSCSQYPNQRALDYDPCKIGCG